MRILHFMNSSFSADQYISGGDGLSGAGGWLTALIELILKNTEHSLAVCSHGLRDKEETAEGGRLQSFAIKRRRARGESAKFLAKCSALVKSWKPDVVHVHGTEDIYGLLSARGLIGCPVVISLQGLAGPCSEWYHYFGNRRLIEVIRMHRCLELLASRGAIHGYRRSRAAARREREIIENNVHFIGRTDWDRAHVQAMNPNARYYHVDEPLRKPFMDTAWDIRHIQRHRIMFTNAGHPRKGADLLFDVLRILRPEYPRVQLSIAGTISRRSGYGKYLRKRMMAYSHAITEEGPLKGAQMAEALRHAHVFAHPSYIDNSPNSLAEAQMVGMPVVATYTGGVPSLMQDGESGLFCPTGDAPMIADQIRRIFDNDELAMRLGATARIVATRRHNPDIILESLAGVYEKVLGSGVQN